MKYLTLLHNYYQSMYQNEFDNVYYTLIGLHLAINYNQGTQRSKQKIAGAERA